MSNMPWFRFYSEALNDRKIQRICRMAQQPKAVVIGVWATFLCLANDSPERGKLMFAEDMWLTEEEIQSETGLDPVTFGKVVKAFQQLEMISIGAGYMITNWDSRQFGSDNSTERVRRHRAKKQREKKAKQETKRGETFQERSGNVIDTDTDTDTETHTEGGVGGVTAPESAIGALSVYFCELTNAEPPAENRNRAWRGWIADLDKLLTLGDGDVEKTKALMSRVKSYMDENDLTYTRPGSLLNIARRFVTGPPQKDGPSPEEQTAVHKAELLFDWLVQKGREYGRMRYREWGVDAALQETAIDTLGNDFIDKVTGENPYQYQKDFIDGYAKRQVIAAA